MNKTKVFNTRFIAGVGILTAVEVVLYIIGTVISGMGTPINLGLIPIAIAAIVYGPIAGAFLGLINGICVLLTPATQLFYFDTAQLGDLCVIGTLINCLGKCTLAGLASGYIYKALKKHNLLAVILATIIVPILNTGIFLGVGFIFYERGMYDTILKSVVTINFLWFELLPTALLCPVTVKVAGMYYLKRKTVENGGNNNE